MNIVEILKDYPKGTELYSPAYGKVYFSYISDVYSIVVNIYSHNNNRPYNVSFCQDGKLNANFDGECMLFPSKENRDWSTFKVPEKEYNFKPFDKVLVRDDDFCNWDINLFSYINNSDEYKYKCLYSDWDQCIPYEGNEHLLGTNNPA